MMMATPVCNQMRCPSVYPAAQNEVVVTAAAVDQAQSLNMTLMTEEGDKVTLNYNTQAQATVVAYDERGVAVGHASQTQARYADVAFGQELTLTVDGDLNKEEQRDVRKALKRIGKMVTAFLQGKMEQAARHAAKLSDLDTVDNIQASYGLTYSATTIVAATQTRQYAPIDTTPFDRPAGDHRLAQATESEIEEIDDLTEEMAQILGESELEPEECEERSDRLFKQLVDELEPGHWWHRRAVALLEMIRERLESRLEQNGDTRPMPSDAEDPALHWV